MAKGIKTGGRQKGTPNLINKQMRDKLESLSEIAFKSLEKGIKAGNPVHLRIWFDYTLSKPKQGIEIEQNGGAKTIIITPASLPPFMKIKESIS